MAAAYKSISTAIQPSGTSVGIAVPTHSAGDLLLCLIVGYDDTDSMTLSPPATGTWTALTDSVEERGVGQTQNLRARVWGRAATGSEPGTLSPSSDVSAYLVGALMVVEGADTSTILDATSVPGTGDTSTRANAGITTATNDALLVMFSAGYNGTVGTPPSGMTQRSNFDSVSYAYTEARPTAGASGSRNASQSVASSYITLLLAIKPAAGGGVSATLSATLEAASLSATGAVDVQGALSATLGGATLAATAAAEVQATLSATLEGAALAAEATSGAAPAEATLAATLDAATLSATATVEVQAALAATLAAATLSAAATADLAPGEAALAATLADATLSATGAVAIQGSLSATLAGATLSATATASGGPLSASLAATLAGVTLSATLGVSGSGVLPPSREEIVADVTQPTFDVEYWNGASWVSVKEHVTDAAASIDAQGGAQGAAAMGPNVAPEATVELAVAGWVQAGNRTPVRISFGFASSANAVRFGGIITGRSRGPRYGRWQLRGWDAHIEGQEVRSPLLKRRPIATATALTSVEDPSLSTYRAGLINYILWVSGGRPYEQRLSYPSAVFYYACTTALIGPEYTWIPGDNPWDVARRLCRAAGGQLYQDGEGVVRYVDPITLASGSPAFTFSDEALTQEQRAAQGKAGYEDIQLEINALAAVTGVSCTFVGRRVQGLQTVYEDATPRQIAAGATLALTCDTQLPLYSLGGATLDAAVIRTAAQATSAQVTVAATLSSAQRVTVTIVNTLSEPVIVDALRITGRPVSAGEEGSASYASGAGRVVSVEDSPYIQSERHAAQLCRMVFDAEANGGELYSLSGCGYDPDRFVGEVVGLTSSEFALSNLRCRIVRIDGDGIWMDVVLAPLGSLPTRDSVHIIGAVSGTKDLAY